MTKHHFVIKTDHDETEELWVDGKRLLSTNHDEHGWEGMRAVRETAEAIAKVIGATFEEGVSMDGED